MVFANPWTEEICRFLKDHWTTASRATIASMIGEKFGVRVSRNAVISKGSRLGLEREPNVRSTGRPTTRVRTPSKPKPQTRTAPFRPAKPVKVEPFGAREAHVEPRRIPFAEISEETCKYECSGDPEPANFLFCGNRPLPGFPYCAGHARICFLQDNRRRARA